MREKALFFKKDKLLSSFVYTKKDWDNIKIDWLIPNDILANELTIVYAKKTMKNHFLNFLFSFVVKDRQDKTFYFMDLENSTRTIIENGFADFTKNNANFKHLSKKKMSGKENEIFDIILSFDKIELSSLVFIINKLDICDDKQKQIDRLDKLRDLGATIILVIDYKELDLNSLEYVPDVEILEASKFF